MAEHVLASPTDDQRELARRELARRRAISVARRGVPHGPMPDDHKESISAGVRRAYAERRAAIEAVMREELGDESRE